MGVDYYDQSLCIQVFEETEIFDSTEKLVGIIITVNIFMKNN